MFTKYLTSTSVLGQAYTNGVEWRIANVEKEGWRRRCDLKFLMVLRLSVAGKGGKTDKNEPEKFQDADSLDFNTAGTRMVEVVERFTGELAPLRVGRADASLLEPIQVSVKVQN